MVFSAGPWDVSDWPEIAMLSPDELRLVAATLGPSLTTDVPQGQHALLPEPARAMGGFYQKAASGAQTVKTCVLRTGKEKPADKVSLPYQCLVSRLRGYPSCYYKMFFR